MTQCTSDLAGLTLSINECDSCVFWADAEGLSYLFIIKGMTTNEEICRATLRCTSANHEPVTSAHAHAARETWPFIAVTLSSRVREE